MLEKKKEWNKVVRLKLNVRTIAAVIVGALHLTLDSLHRSVVSATFMIKTSKVLWNTVMLRLDDTPSLVLCRPEPLILALLVVNIKTHWCLLLSAKVFLLRQTAIKIVSVNGTLLEKPHKEFLLNKFTLEQLSSV